MFCNRCGNQIQDGAAFCEACGARVADMMPDDTYEGPTGTGNKGAAATASTQPQPTDPMGQATPNGGSGGHRLSPPALIGLIVAAVVTVAIAAGLIHHFLIAPTQEPTEAQFAAGQNTSGQTAGGQDSSNGSSSSSGSSTGTSEPTVSANQRKVDDALAGGAQVFTGTVDSTTYAQRQTDLGLPASTGFSNEHKTLVLLLLDQEVPVTARQWGTPETPFKTRETSSIALGTSFASYDGQRVTVAIHAEDMGWPSDVAGVLYGAGIAENAEVLFTGTDDSIVIGSPNSASSNSGASTVAGGSADFVLPDSNTRVYSVSELRGMGLSKPQLRIARNEIYARHGRSFDDAGLQSYFDSKSWYTRRYDPDRFDEGQLSGTERTNIDNIKKVEG